MENIKEASHHIEEVSQTIIKAMSEGGWNLYHHGEDENNVSEPASVLKIGILYDVLPRTGGSVDREAVAAMPRIMVPDDGFPNFGRVVVVFSEDDKEEAALTPGEAVYFLGIELQEKEVRLLCPSKTYMPYDVFLKALENLQNTTFLPLGQINTDVKKVALSHNSAAS